MRVAIVRRLPGIAFSMDVYADNLAAGLKAIRPEWEITQIAPRPWSKDHAWRSGTGLRKYYERFWRHPRAVAQQQADIFHIIDHSSGHVVHSLRKVGKPAVVTCHDLVQSIYSTNLQGQSRFPWLSNTIWRYSTEAMQHADHVIAVSSNTQKDIVQVLNINPERITVIANGVESDFQRLPNRAAEQLRTQHNVSPETICLLNVGTNHPRKNLMTVLNVVKRLTEQGISVQLWKTGDDFTEEQQAFIKTNDLERSVTYLGKPSKPTLAQIYNAADILLAPSLYEGFGLTVLEAMACGTPVITSNVSSLPEVTGDAAILVDPMDVQAMTEAVCTLQQNPAYRAELIDKGLARAKAFTWQRAAEKIALIYEDLVNARSNGASQF